VICAFIDANRDEHGVEPICRVLTEHRCPIAPSTYYDARNRPPSARTLRDEELKTVISAAHEENRSLYGAHKIWIALRRKGIDVARCTVERLMTELGLRGVLRGRAPRTTVADPKADRAKDLVGRNFNPVAPNRLWVADFKCRRRHLKSYADLRIMPMTSAMVCSGKAFGAVWSA